MAAAKSRSYDFRQKNWAVFVYKIDNMNSKIKYFDWEHDKLTY